MPSFSYFRYSYAANSPQNQYSFFRSEKESNKKYLHKLLIRNRGEAFFKCPLVVNMDTSVLVY